VFKFEDNIATDGQSVVSQQHPLDQWALEDAHQGGAVTVHYF
jgi:hypothetical protein